MKKFGITFLLLLSTALIVLKYKNITIRRDIPYIEIIPLDQGIAIINTKRWFLEKLQVAIHPAGDKKKIVFNEQGICLIHNLSNNTTYTIEVSRTDMKGRILYKTSKTQVTPVKGGANYYVLVGASVGNAWHFNELPARFGFNKKNIFGFRAKYQFDKTEEINRILNLPIPVTGIIIKECAAYFPRDLKTSKQQVINWVATIKKNQVTPILATVVPVTPANAANNPGRIESIWAYNDFIREYARQERLKVLDLERAARVSDTNRYLNENYAQEDGLHLNRKGYEQGLNSSIKDMGIDFPN